MKRFAFCSIINSFLALLDYDCMDFYVFFVGGELCIAVLDPLF